jgi:Protein of unknown function (DUF2934)
MNDAQQPRDRIRARAHAIWLEEGRPEGQAERHWALAADLIAMEDIAEPPPEPAEGGGFGLNSEVVEFREVLPADELSQDNKVSDDTKEAPAVVAKPKKAAAKPAAPSKGRKAPVKK